MLCAGVSEFGPAKLVYFHNVYVRILIIGSRPQPCYVVSRNFNRVAKALFISYASLLNGQFLGLTNSSTRPELVPFHSFIVALNEGEKYSRLAI